VTGHPVRAFIGVGSNLGDRLANVQQAVDRLARTEGIRVVRASRVYETDPVGPPQPDYLNAVVEVATVLRPRGLLEACLGVEAAMGRVRAERWGPRIVDLDVLTYGDEQIDEPRLTVPHPRMLDRAFVLVPLLELEPDPRLPDGRRVAAIRLGPKALGAIRPFAPPPSVPSSGVPRSHHIAGARTRPDAPRS
jgi:2-amino-4-hydroxy-6-hydroxymethyldihydropteridine diphosphokinase